MKLNELVGAADPTDRGIAGDATIFPNYLTERTSDVLVQHANGQVYTLQPTAEIDTIRRMREALANAGRITIEVTKFGTARIGRSSLGQIRSWNRRPFDPTVREINGEMRRAHFDGLLLVTQDANDQNRLSQYGLQLRTHLLEAQSSTDTMRKMLEYTAALYPNDFDFDGNEIKGLTPNAVFFLEDLRAAAGVTTPAQQTEESAAEVQTEYEV